VPFESQVIFDFCPPGKRHGSDIDQLSGGEKSIAALSFIFALAKVSKPPMMILDEVDAFLDSENVECVTQYLRKNQ
jgi:chromosome segregation ATPase